jgi:alpha-galactosidase
MNDAVSIIKVPYCETDLRPDDMDHPAWEAAASVSLAHYWSGEPAPAARGAQADLLWSDRALHIRFTYPQLEPMIVASEPDVSRRAIGLWDRDVCEAFISIDPRNPERYLEFEVAPTGEWLDAGIHQLPDHRETDFEVVTDMTVAASVDGQTIRLAMRLPWDGLKKKPAPGDEWRANLFRCVGSDPERGYITWRPTYAQEPNFHVPEAFGYLIFLGKSDSGDSQV